MDAYFKGLYEKKGYVLLGWVYFFSQQPIHWEDDLCESKPVMWEGDPLVEQVYKGLDV